MEGTDDRDNIIATAIALGMALHNQMVNPSGDKISQRNAINFLRQRHIASTKLNVWCDMGLLHKRKDGDRNSKVYYSIAELNKCILENQL